MTGLDRSRSILSLSPLASLHRCEERDCPVVMSHGSAPWLRPPALPRSSVDLSRSIELFACSISFWNRAFSRSITAQGQGTGAERGPKSVATNAN